MGPPWAAPASFWSAEEYLSGVRPHVPAMADPYTGKSIQRDTFTG